MSGDTSQIITEILDGSESFANTSLENVEILANDSNNGVQISVSKLQVINSDLSSTQQSKISLQLVAESKSDTQFSKFILQVVRQNKSIALITGNTITVLTKATPPFHIAQMPVVALSNEMPRANISQNNMSAIVVDKSSANVSLVRTELLDYNDLGKVAISQAQVQVLKYPLYSTGIISSTCVSILRKRESRKNKYAMLITIN